MNTGTGNGRIDWRTERDRIDLASVASGLLGPAAGRIGEHGRRLWWHCPFHQDRNPSFMIEPGKPWWKCWGCGESGDAANLMMKLEGLSFPEARARLTGRSAPSGTERPRPSSPARLREPAMCVVMRHMHRVDKRDQHIDVEQIGHSVSSRRA